MAIVRQHHFDPPKEGTISSRDRLFRHSLKECIGYSDYVGLDDLSGWYRGAPSGGRYQGGPCHLKRAAVYFRTMSLRPVPTLFCISATDNEGFNCAKNFLKGCFERLFFGVRGVENSGCDNRRFLLYSIFSADMEDEEDYRGTLGGVCFSGSRTLKRRTVSHAVFPH